MKVFLIFVATIILLNLITVTKQAPCGDDEIRISPLGKCKKLNDFLKFKSL